MHAFMPIVALGLLGIDPIGALLIISALMAGARRYRVLIFTATFIGGTVLLGTVLSLLGQGAIDYLQSFIPHSTSPLWAILSLAVIVAIIAWLTVHDDNPHYECPDCRAKFLSRPRAVDIAAKLAK